MPKHEIVQVVEDLLPTPPWIGPPLPRFLTRNPGAWKEWTSPEQYIEAAEKAGDWAASRSAAMLSRADIMTGKLDEMADSMYRRMMVRMGISPTTAKEAKAAAKRPRKKKAVAEPGVEGEVVTEVKVRMKKPTDVDIYQITEDLSNIRRTRGYIPNMFEIEDFGKTKGFELTSARVTGIFNKLTEEKPIVIEELKQPVMEAIRKETLTKPREVEGYVRFQYGEVVLPEGLADIWLEEAAKGE